MEVDSDDSVVHRIPVVLSKGLDGRLFVYEYPREPMVLQDFYTEQKVVKSRIKPKQQKVEMHLEISKHSNNFNPGQAKKLAAKSTKSSADAGSAAPMVETQILSSTSAISQTQDQFAIGVMHEDERGQMEVHLHPLQGIINLKQSYSYMDLTDKKLDSDKTKPVADPGLAKAGPSKAVGVRFARQDPKRMAQAQAKTAQQRLKEEEPWCETDFYPASSSQSKLEKMKLVSDHQESNASTVLVDTPETFLPVLCSRQLNQASGGQIMGLRSASNISKLPFNEQVIERMKQAHILPYSKLKKYLDSSKSDSEILTALQRAAVPVRGNWVVSSELLYAKELITSHGSNRDKLCRGRDKILYLLSKRDVIKISDAMEATQLPSEDIAEILKSICCKKKQPDGASGWMLKLPQDTSFTTQYPDEAERLFRKFELKVQNIGRREEEERASSDSRSAGPAAKKSRSSAPRVRKNSTKSRKDSYSSDH